MVILIMAITFAEDQLYLFVYMSDKQISRGHKASQSSSNTIQLNSIQFNLLYFRRILQGNVKNVIKG